MPFGLLKSITYNKIIKPPSRSNPVIAYIINTIAGNGGANFTGDGGAATSATFFYPTDVYVDSTGNVYIADAGNNCIRFISKNGGTYYGVPTTAGNIYTIAGDGNAAIGEYSGDGGPPTNALLNFPECVYVDLSGNVFITDTYNYRIRFISKNGGSYYGVSTTAGNIYTIAGNGSTGYSGDNVAPTSTSLDVNTSVYVDSIGNVFIADAGNNRIRFISKYGGPYYGVSTTAGRIYTIAGTGAGGYNGDNVASNSATLDIPNFVYVDLSGNVFIADNSNNRIRFISKNGGPYYGISTTAGRIYTIAGNGSTGYGGDNVAPTSTSINSPECVYVDAIGNVFIADTGNHRIRFISKYGGSYYGISTIAGNIYTIAGNGNIDYSGDNVAPTSTSLYYPNGVYLDSNRNVYISDQYNQRIRKIQLQ